MARELKATVRSETGRHAAERLRRQNVVPAVIYREGKPGTNLSLDESEWVKVLSSGQRVVTLKMDGGDRSALIKDVQYNHLGTKTLHVDFNELKAGQKVRLAVSVVLKGVPKGASVGGHLNHVMHTIHVECLPEHIPERVTIDVEPMELDDILHIRDVKLAAELHAIDDPNLVVCSVHEPRHEEVAVAPVEGAPTEPEVITAKKEEAPAEGAAGAPAGGPPPKGEAKKEEKKK
ncbi:MAG TPA: 50S ribosomal protein L25 [Planctomycetota bacterium]|nr:50S ribosomal protein L25 [Planctomycetota bacterium]